MSDSTEKITVKKIDFFFPLKVEEFFLQKFQPDCMTARTSWNFRGNIR